MKTKRYYVYVEYEEIYPILFERIKKGLIKSIGKLSKISKIEHIGSSSVPGLGGKGLIDILIALPKTKMEKARDLLIKHGYKRDPKHEFGIRYFFRKNYIGFGKRREMHVSITTKGSWMWKSAIATRDYLRNYPRKMMKYAKIKKQGAKIARGKGEKYKKYKSAFLKQITQEAMNASKK